MCLDAIWQICCRDHKEQEPFLSLPLDDKLTSNFGYDSRSMVKLDLKVRSGDQEQFSTHQLLLLVEKSPNDCGMTESLSSYEYQPSQGDFIVA